MESHSFIKCISMDLSQLLFRIVCVFLQLHNGLYIQWPQRERPLLLLRKFPELEVKSGVVRLLDMHIELQQLQKAPLDVVDFL